MNIYKLFYSNIYILKIILPVLFFFHSSCALLLITEEDKQASRDKRENPSCSDCKNKNYNNSSRKKFSKSTTSGSVDKFIEELSSPSDAVRTGAATQLGLIGRPAHTAVPALEYAAINDPSKWVRRAAVKALPKIGVESSLKVLEKAKSDSDYYVKASAEKSLSNWQYSRARLKKSRW